MHLVRLGSAAETSSQCQGPLAPAAWAPPFHLWALGAPWPQSVSDSSVTHGGPAGKPSSSCLRVSLRSQCQRWQTPSVPLLWG